MTALTKLHEQIAKVPTSRACCLALCFGSTEKWMSLSARSSMEMVYGRLVSGFTHFSARMLATSLNRLSNSTSRSLSETYVIPHCSQLETAGHALFLSAHGR